MSPRSAERAFEEASMTERLVSRLRSIVSRDDTAGSRSLSQSGKWHGQLQLELADAGGEVVLLEHIGAHCSRLGAQLEKASTTVDA